MTYSDFCKLDEGTRVKVKGIRHKPQPYKVGPTLHPTDEHPEGQALIHFSGDFAGTPDERTYIPIDRISAP